MTRSSTASDQAQAGSSARCTDCHPCTISISGLSMVIESAPRGTIGRRRRRAGTSALPKTNSRILRRRRWRRSCHGRIGWRRHYGERGRTMCSSRNLEHVPMTLGAASSSHRTVLTARYPQPVMAGSTPASDAADLSPARVGNTRFSMPSTSFAAKQDVDGRHGPGHDAPRQRADARYHNLPC